MRYSRHAEQRRKERGIGKDIVQCILDKGIDRVVIPSAYDKEVTVLLAFVDKKGYAIIVNEKENCIITVRRMQKREEKLLKEKLEKGKSNEKKR